MAHLSKLPCCCQFSDFPHSFHTYQFLIPPASHSMLLLQLDDIPLPNFESYYSMLFSSKIISYLDLPPPRTPFPPRSLAPQWLLHLLKILFINQQSFHPTFFRFNNAHYRKISCTPQLNMSPSNLTFQRKIHLRAKRQDHESENRNLKQKLSSPTNPTRADFPSKKNQKHSKSNQIHFKSLQISNGNMNTQLLFYLSKKGILTLFSRRKELEKTASIESLLDLPDRQRNKSYVRKNFSLPLKIIARKKSNQTAFMPTLVAGLLKRKTRWIIPTRFMDRILKCNAKQWQKHIRVPSRKILLLHKAEYRLRYQQSLTFQYGNSWAIYSFGVENLNLFSMIFQKSVEDNPLIFYPIQKFFPSYDIESNITQIIGIEIVKSMSSNAIDSFYPQFSSTSLNNTVTGGPLNSPLQYKSHLLRKFVGLSMPHRSSTSTSLSKLESPVSKEDQSKKKSSKENLSKMKDCQFLQVKVCDTTANETFQTLDGVALEEKEFSASLQQQGAEIYSEFSKGVRPTRNRRNSVLSTPQIKLFEEVDHINGIFRTRQGHEIRKYFIHCSDRETARLVALAYWKRKLESSLVQGFGLELQFNSSQTPYSPIRMAKRHSIGDEVSPLFKQLQYSHPNQTIREITSYLNLHENYNTEAQDLTLALYLENDDYRLKNLKPLPFPWNLHLYSQVLKGYRMLYELYGEFVPDPAGVIVNSQRIVKVWLSPLLHEHTLKKELSTQSKKLQSSNFSERSYGSQTFREIPLPTHKSSKSEANIEIMQQTRNLSPSKSKLSCHASFGQLSQNSQNKEAEILEMALSMLTAFTEWTLYPQRIHGNAALPTANLRPLPGPSSLDSEIEHASYNKQTPSFGTLLCATIPLHSFLAPCRTFKEALLYFEKWVQTEGLKVPSSLENLPSRSRCQNLKMVSSPLKQYPPSTLLSGKQQTCEGLCSAPSFSAMRQKSLGSPCESKWGRVKLARNWIEAEEVGEKVKSKRMHHQEYQSMREKLFKQRQAAKCDIQSGLVKFEKCPLQSPARGLNQRSRNLGQLVSNTSQYSTNHSILTPVKQIQLARNPNQRVKADQSKGKMTQISWAKEDLPTLDQQGDKNPQKIKTPHQNNGYLDKKYNLIENKKIENDLHRNLTARSNFVIPAKFIHLASDSKNIPRKINNSTTYIHTPLNSNDSYSKLSAPFYHSHFEEFLEKPRSIIAQNQKKTLNSHEQKVDLLTQVKIPSASAIRQTSFQPILLGQDSPIFRNPKFYHLSPERILHRADEQKDDIGETKIGGTKQPHEYDIPNRLFEGEIRVKGKQERCKSRFLLQSKTEKESKRQIIGRNEREEKAESDEKKKWINPGLPGKKMHEEIRLEEKNKNEMNPMKKHQLERIEEMRKRYGEVSEIDQRTKNPRLNLFPKNAPGSKLLNQQLEFLQDVNRHFENQNYEQFDSFQARIPQREKNPTQFLNQIKSHSAFSPLGSNYARVSKLRTSPFKHSTSNLIGFESARSQYHAAHTSIEMLSKHTNLFPPPLPIPPLQPSQNYKHNRELA